MPIYYPIVTPKQQIGKSILFLERPVDYQHIDLHKMSVSRFDELPIATCSPVVA